MKIFIALSLVAGLFVISLASADCLRCGESMVGDMKADAIAKCGPPDYSDVTSVIESNGITTKVGIFYYNCGEEGMSTPSLSGAAL